MTTFATHGLHGVGNGTTPVDVVPAPGSSHTFDVRNIIVCNKDTLPIVVTLQVVDSVGPVTRRLTKQTLDVDGTLEFDAIVSLDTTTKKIQMVMAGAPATTQPDWYTSYGDTGP